MSKVLMALLLVAFVLTGTGYAQTPAPTPAVAPAETASSSTATEPAKPVRSHHPELIRALHKLRAAKVNLENAAKDYGGNKAKAITAIEEAIADLQAAIQFDNTNK